MLNAFSYLALSLLAIPFVASSIAFFLASKRALEALSTASTSALVALYGALLAMYPWRGSIEPVFSGVYVEGVKGAVISFACDRFTLVLLGISLVIGLLVVLYSRCYISPSNREHPITSGYSRYYGLMLLFIGSMVGVAMANNLVTLLIFYELTGICSCLLISFYGTPKAARAGFTAFIVTHVGSVALLAATMLTYFYTHGFSYDAMASLRGGALSALGILMLIAALAKSAQLPFYVWLPEAMVAPTTVSAYLHAAAMVKVGVFTFLRFCQYVIARGNTSLLVAGLATVLSLATMFYGAFNYYRQRDLKRLLAWSTIVQLSVMMLALGLSLLQVSETLVCVSAYHMWNHSFAKALLFLTVGAIAYSLGRRDVDALKGLSRIPSLAPLAYLWIVGGLAISAVPPFGCFFSKIALLLAGIRGSIPSMVSVVLAVLEGYLLTLPIFLKLGMKAFREQPSPSLGDAHRVPLSMLGVLIALAVASIASGFLTPISIPW